jgi:cellulose synthase/poly-beta-1,6-N-acetylglucosamine synthase-like glycosyltransferase
VVLTGIDRVVFAVLSAAAFVSLVVFATVWLRLMQQARYPVIALIVGLLVGAHAGIWAARWLTIPRMRRPRVQPVPEGLRVAAVTTFVPTHEPLDMLEQTLAAMVAMEGAHDSWLLDEGDDEATRALCARLGVRHFSRRGEARYNSDDGHFRAASKHGNYNAWLDAVGYAEYDVIAAFDPDHVPEPDYLARTLGHFRDAEVAFVQPPQVYYNQEASFVARGAAEETYAYYSSHLMASYALGHAVVIGSHSAHHLAALRAVGGFPAHDAEDLYLTMLYRAAGWRGVFVPEVLAMGTTPVDWFGYMKQQLRWSRSVIDLKLRVFPRLARRLTALEWALNLLHGIYYLRPLLLPVGYAVLAYLLVEGIVPRFLSPLALGSMIALLLVLQLIDGFRQRFFLDLRHERGFHWRAGVMQLAKWPVFVLAAWEAVRGRRPPYAITRKMGRPNRRWVLAPPHLLLALVIGIAWAVGVARHGAPPPVLAVFAAFIIVTSLVLAWTEARPYPAVFVPGLYERRHASMPEKRTR